MGKLKEFEDHGYNALDLEVTVDEIFRHVELTHMVQRYDSEELCRVLSTYHTDSLLPLTLYLQATSGASAIDYAEFRKDFSSILECEVQRRINSSSDEEERQAYQNALDAFRSSDVRGTR